ncbi:MAG: Stp1/IreP family PP2C-type Ser/Thr phosphatase [Calditrichaeota bacterium]|nr:MAG: Stp1/IreP family PP2C-type Ser/Thr phosphatase [Calditrichota bacterium]
MSDKINTTQENSPVSLSVYAVTHVGMVRTMNEDRFLVDSYSSEKADSLSDIIDLPLNNKGIVLMVSDGMGGAAAGEIASLLAIDAVKKEMVFHNPPSVLQFKEQLKSSLLIANHLIAQEAEKNPALKGMGATATLAGILNHGVYIAQVGDSRAYLIRDNEIQLLTNDQSYVYQLWKSGAITEEEARVHPQRNIILQALGVQKDLEVELTQFKAQVRDRLLLCSDGLSGLLTNEEILEVVKKHPSLKDCCHNLVELANQKGGYDNITVVLGEFKQ